ncbi:hypothetical protein VNO77_00645 [Canavalia gladiata]|uniref:Uncharacterized protein n=1 Tax=Canavalia gladiata TaxID=3824 RepID=A0AAN9MQE0_CANGL
MSVVHSKFHPPFFFFFSLLHISYVKNDVSFLLFGIPKRHWRYDLSQGRADTSHSQTLSLLIKVALLFQVEPAFTHPFLTLGLANLKEAWIRKMKRDVMYICIYNLKTNEAEAAK